MREPFDLVIRHKSWWWLIPSWAILSFGMYFLQRPDPVWIRGVVWGLCFSVYWHVRDRAPMWRSLNRRAVKETPEYLENILPSDGVLPEGWTWDWEINPISRKGVLYFAAARRVYSELEEESFGYTRTKYFDRMGRPFEPQAFTTDLIRSGIRREGLEE
jgi:hypothetical protein